MLFKKKSHLRGRAVQENGVGGGGVEDGGGGEG